MGTCLAVSSLSRPYHELSTASHPHSEVKPRRARIVQTWGTRLEVLVLRFFAFFADDNNVQATVSYTVCTYSTAFACDLSEIHSHVLMFIRSFHCQHSATYTIIKMQKSSFISFLQFVYFIHPFPAFDSLIRW